MKKHAFAKLGALAALALSLTGCVPSEAADGTAGAGGMAFTVIYLVAIVAIMYFVMIRPERKRKKEAEEMRSSISVGVTVTTIGGIVGKVVDVKDDFITIETSEDRVRVELAKWGISSVGKKKDENEQSAS
ncbi:MAG: preprotein translocase subunit YajC [bacterium]